jgi:putative flippase GtrA
VRFVRFVLAGGASAAVNISVRLLLSKVVAYEVAVVLAYLVGMATAFVLMRAFVFEASGNETRSQMIRFTLVNLVALAQVWVVSVALARWLFPALGFTWHAETVAHVIGVGSPILTSYAGHRFYSFRKQAEAD